MLPVRIELTTSPLPRECSTTELRQQRATPEKPRGPAHGERHKSAAILAIGPATAQALAR